METTLKKLNKSAIAYYIFHKVVDDLEIMLQLRFCLYTDSFNYSLSCALSIDLRLQVKSKQNSTQDLSTHNHIFHTYKIS